MAGGVERAVQDKLGQSDRSGSSTVEQGPHKALAAGSNPARTINHPNILEGILLIRPASGPGYFSRPVPGFLLLGIDGFFSDAGRAAGKKYEQAMHAIPRPFQSSASPQFGQARVCVKMLFPVQGLDVALSVVDTANNWDDCICVHLTQDLDPSPFESPAQLSTEKFGFEPSQSLLELGHACQEG